MHVCIFVCIHMHVCTCMYTYVCIHMYAHIRPSPPSFHLVCVQGDKDWDAFKKSKAKKAPWWPASELQKKVHALSLHPSRVWCTRQCACECACARACARAYACLYACPYRKVERWSFYLGGAYYMHTQMMCTRESRTHIWCRAYM